MNSSKPQRPKRHLRITREGKYFLAMTLAVGFAAINTGNNLLYLLLGWMLSVTVISGLLSEIAVRRIRVSRHPPSHIYATQPFPMRYQLSNHKRFWPSYSLAITDLWEGRPYAHLAYAYKVNPKADTTATCSQTWKRRGLYHLDGIRVATQFPFSLFEKALHFTLPAELLVYPALHAVHLPGYSAGAYGEDPAQRISRQGDFYGLREYRRGDDPRQIHWRTSAHRGRLLLREYEEEAHRRVTVVLDNSHPPPTTPPTDTPFADVLERTISLAASLAQNYLAKEYTVAFIARGVYIPHARGPKQLFRILRTLALITVAERPFASVPPLGTEAILLSPHGHPPPDKPPGITMLWLTAGALRGH